MPILKAVAARLAPSDSAANANNPPVASVAPVAKPVVDLVKLLNENSVLAIACLKSSTPAIVLITDSAKEWMFFASYVIIYCSLLVKKPYMNIVFLFFNGGPLRK